MKPLGAQLIAEFIDCSRRLLNDATAIEKVLEEGIASCGLNLIGLHSHRFDPVGVTSVAIIGESHVVVHTYPEARHVSADIFTCSNGSKPQIDLMHYLRRHFRPKTLRFTEIQRGNPLETKQRDWITSCSDYGFEIRYHVKRHIYSKKSRYQQIDVIDNESFGRMLFLDHDLQIAEKDAQIYDRAMVDPLLRHGRRPGRVAILGGGDGGVLRELLIHDPRQVVLIDIDGEVVQVAKKHLKPICDGAFSDPRVEVIIEDANVYLEGVGGFDSVIYDLTTQPASLTKLDRNEFLRSLFAKVARSLRKGGILSMQCCSEFDTSTRKLLRRILSPRFCSFEFRKVFVPSFCENWLFASARRR